MKNLLFLFLFIGLTLAGCNKCTDCDYGECESGECELWQKTVSGTYVGTFTINGSTQANEFVKVTPGTKDNMIEFDNGFHGSLNNKVEFDIPSQTYFDVIEQATATVSGSGKFINGGLSMTFTLNIDGNTYNCQFSGE